MGDPTSRVLDLLTLLQTHRFWLGAELCARLGVSDRTLRRDIDRLRALGYPVDATPGVAGGYRLAAGAHMPPLLVDDDEAVAIAVGLRAAAEAPVEGIEEMSVRALAKLEQVLPDRLRRRVQALHANVVPMRWGNTGPMVDPEALVVLSQACRDGEQVRFEYRRRDGESGRRLVEPHQLVAAGRVWYLVAWDVRRKDWRTFRVDRLHDARLAGARFRPRRLPAEDAAAFVAASLRAIPTRYRVRVNVDASAEQVAAEVRYVGGEVEELEGGRCVVHLGGDHLDGLTLRVAAIAARFPSHVDGPDELCGALEHMAGALTAAVDGVDGVAAVEG